MWLCCLCVVQLCPCTVLFYVSGALCSETHLLGASAAAEQPCLLCTETHGGWRGGGGQHERNRCTTHVGVSWCGALCVPHCARPHHLKLLWGCVVCVWYSCVRALCCFTCQGRCAVRLIYSAPLRRPNNPIPKGSLICTPLTEASTCVELGDPELRSPHQAVEPGT